MTSLAIITSSGRRVSMLCDDDSTCYDYSSSYFTSNPASPLPPFSLGRPSVCERSDSFCSTASYNSVSLSPSTPSSPTLHGFSAYETDQFASSFNSMNFAKNTVSAQSEEGESVSQPPTPSDDLVVKKALRKHTCKGCNKFFTTSGHLARHSRIHTGEKNYTCMAPGCPARFSRQDNCMQHYRTHLAAGNGSKRSNRKKQTLSPEILGLSESLQPRYSSTYPSYSSLEIGLDALANVAASAYV